MDSFANYKCPLCGTIGTVLFEEPVQYCGYCESIPYEPKNTEFDSYVGCSRCHAEMEMVG